jgi:hypothetical protein
MACILCEETNKWKFEPGTVRWSGQKDLIRDFTYTDITTHAVKIQKTFLIIIKLKLELYPINDAFLQNVIGHFWCLIHVRAKINL